VLHHFETTHILRVNMTESSSPPPFLALGQAIAAAREARGLATQADLASALEVSQQTVSRWEAGTHRPAQVAALAKVLGLEAAKLVRLAGYDTPPADSFVTPLPVDRFVDGNTLELFTSYFLTALHPEAEVRRAGGSGHDQDGVDVWADFPDGRRWAVQCKRHARFGPAEVKAAVAAFTGAADRRILVLSRIASPQAAEEVRRAGWTLWDKDDISRIFRQELSDDAQDRLVDIFWRSQRQALLGRGGPSPWLTADEFFRPFSASEAALSHDWALVGRDEDASALLAALKVPRPPAVLLIAAAGMGKSRLLKAVAAQITEREPATVLRFLGRDSELTPASLAALGDRPKLLVIDDAHDRDGLGALFQFAADPANETRLLLATRPYAEARIRGEAFAYAMKDLPTVSLEPLTKAQLTALAGAVLTAYRVDDGGADEGWAEAVVTHAGDSPLTVAMAARLVAQDGAPLELVRAASSVQDLILGKFAKVVVGDLGQPGDEALNREVLEVLALAQPFHPADPHLLEFIAAVKGVPPDKAGRALRNLIEGGVAFKRGQQHRLMPDLLGDYLIERSCLDAAQDLSPFAFKALSAVPGPLVSRVFVNLARLDWRRSGGDTAKSRLLGQVWRGLDTIQEEWDDRLAAVKDVAVYQPVHALEFCRDMIVRGRRLSALADILRTVAYVREESFNDACALLWELGRNNTHQWRNNSSHPIRVLSEFGEYQIRKPVGFSQKLLAFAHSLMDDARNWEGAYTPLDLLKPLLKGDGEETTSDFRTVTFAPFFVHYDVVQPLRAEVIKLVLFLLTHPRERVARLAANFLETTLTSPFGTFGAEPEPELTAAYTAEFETTLEAVLGIVRAHPMPAVVTLGIARSVAWYSRHAEGRALELCEQILANLPTDLAFRLIAALTDGYGQTFVVRDDPDEWESDLQGWLDGVVAQLLADRLDAEERRAAVEQALAALEAAGEPLSSAHPLFFVIVKTDTDFARALLDDALARADSRTRQFAGIALGRLLEVAPAEGRATARCLIATGETDLAQAVASAFGGLTEARTSDDMKLFEGLLRGPPAVVATALRSISTWRETDPRLIIDLLKRADLQGSAGLSDSLSMAMAGIRRRDLLPLLTRDDVLSLLTSLEPIAELEGHWVNEFLAELSARFPHETADFLMRRVERAAESKTYSFQAAGPRGHGQKRLRFLESDEGVAVLRRMRRWLAANHDRDGYFTFAANAVFEAMFLHDLDKVVEVFGPDIPVATSGELGMIAGLFRNAHHSFIMTHTAFVVRFLERCGDLDPDLLDRATSSFFNSAIGGVRSSMPGVPPPREVEQLAQAQQRLAQLSYASPARRLFEWVAHAAQQDIDRAVADGRRTEDA
jgi:transcriptional regulator with XRE-family HTH domain